MDAAGTAAEADRGASRKARLGNSPVVLAAALRPLEVEDLEGVHGGAQDACTTREDASDEFRSAVADAVLPMESHAGQILFQHGQPGDWMGIVISGKLDVYVQRQMREFHVGDVGPGGIIGDLALFGLSQQRSNTVVSLMPSVLLVLAHDKFQTLLATHAEGDAPQSLAMFQDGAYMHGLVTDKESFAGLQCFKRLERDAVMAFH